jgi:hypothetical protein
VVEHAAGVGRQVAGVEVNLVEVSPDRVAEDGVEELLLVAEVGVDALFAAGGPFGNAVHAGTRDPVGRELLGRRLHDAGPRLVCIACHASILPTN